MTRFKGIKIFGKKPYEIFIKDKEKDCYIGTEDEVVDLLNEQSDTIEGLILDRNRQEEKLDIARRNLSKQLEKIEELEEENRQLRKINSKGKCGVTVKNQEISKSENFKEKEPYYYKCNGLSPNQAFEQGLISKREFIGFIKGNVIKYVVRCDKKENIVEDIDKAIDYLVLLKKMVKKWEE